MSIFEAFHFKLLHSLCSEFVNERVNNKSEAAPGKNGFASCVKIVC